MSTQQFKKVSQFLKVSVNNNLEFGNEHTITVNSLILILLRLNNSTPLIDTS